jgi:hypothetical protein
MARKAGQILARVASTWLVRFYLGRDVETGTRKYDIYFGGRELRHNWCPAARAH